MTLQALSEQASAEKLEVFGLCHTQPGDDLPNGTLVLLGPSEPGYWAHVSASPEFKDGLDDPIDRWSQRIITEMARRFDGTPLFPFGKPVRPFMTWAIRSGRAWSSPVQLLVHDVAGLMVSYRGAVLLPEVLELPNTPEKPCDNCATRSCLADCPSMALVASGYDVPKCHGFLKSHQGAFCMGRGCAVRRGCPVSKTYRRVDAQSAYHMERFCP